MKRTADPASTLDPDVAGIEHAMAAAGLLPFFPANTGARGWAVEARRRGVEARERFYPPHVGGVDIVETAIPGPRGPIPVRVQIPQEETTAGVLHFHGGGWVIGGLDSHRGEANRIARQARAKVFQIDYRLAPEHPHPAGVEDAVAALDWAIATGAEWGVDRWAVTGGSAGGNLAAIVAAHARDRGVALAGQLLVYPSTDLAFVPRDDVVLEAYAPGALDLSEPTLSPAQGDLRGLAPVVLGVGDLDFLLPDNLAFAERLREAGVDVSLHVYGGLPHGFFGYDGVSARCDAAVDELVSAFAGLLHPLPRG